MLAHRPAFDTEDAQGFQVAVAVAHKGLRPKLPVETPSQIYNLLVACWSETPENRPDFGSIIQSIAQLQFDPNIACSTLGGRRGVLKSAQQKLQKQSDPGPTLNVQIDRTAAMDAVKEPQTL